MSNFVERLSELIWENEKNAKTLGEELGCGNSTISHYLTDRHLPTVEMAVKLADYFKCSVDFLIGIKDEGENVVCKPCPPFCERLPALCKELKTSRYAIEKKTGISESCLRYWSQGKTTPSLLNIVKIAEKYNVSVDFVLGRES